MRVGLMGYGKAGPAVVQVLQSDPRCEPCWVPRRTLSLEAEQVTGPEISITTCPRLDSSMDTLLYLLQCIYPS